MRAHPGEFRDHLVYGKIWIGATRPRLDLLKPRISRRLVFLVVDVLCSRPDNDGAVDCWRDEDALAHLAGALEHSRRERAVLVAVEHQVFASPRRNRIFPVAYEVVQLVRVGPCAVHDSPRGKLASILARHHVGERRVRHIVAMRHYADDIHHLRLEEKLCAVCSRVLRIAEGKFVWAADAAGRRPQSRRCLGRDVRLAAPQLVLRDDLRRNAVPLAALLQLAQGRLVLRAEGEDD